jgi:hypothetical protein
MTATAFGCVAEELYRPPPNVLPVDLAQVPAMYAEAQSQAEAMSQAMNSLLINQMLLQGPGAAGRGYAPLYGYQPRSPGAGFPGQQQNNGSGYPQYPQAPRYPGQQPRNGSGFPQYPQAPRLPGQQPGNGSGYQQPSPAPGHGYPGQRPNNGSLGASTVPGAGRGRGRIPGSQRGGPRGRGRQGAPRGYRPPQGPAPGDGDHLVAHEPIGDQQPSWKSEASSGAWSGWEGLWSHIWASTPSGRKGHVCWYAFSYALSTVGARPELFTQYASCLAIYLCSHLAIYYLPTYLSIYLSVCLSVCLSSRDILWSPIEGGCTSTMDGW